MMSAARRAPSKSLLLEEVVEPVWIGQGMGTTLLWLHDADVLAAITTEADRRYKIIHRPTTDFMYLLR